jgi:hypothetical protein
MPQQKAARQKEIPPAPAWKCLPGVVVYLLWLAFLVYCAAA